MNKSKSDAGSPLQPDTTGAQILWFLTQELKRDTEETRSRIEKVALSQIRQLLNYEQETKTLQDLYVQLKNLKSVVQSDIEMIEADSGKAKARIPENRLPELMSLLTHLNEATQRLSRVQSLIEENFKRLASRFLGSFMQSRNELPQLLIELRVNLEELRNVVERALATLGSGTEKLDPVIVAKFKNDFLKDLNKVIDSMRASDVDALSKQLLSQLTEARRARTSLINRNSRVKAILRVVEADKGKEDSLLTFHIGEDRNRLNEWLENAFKAFQKERKGTSIDVLGGAFKKEWDVFTKKALFPASSPSDFTSAHEKRIFDFFSKSKKWSADPKFFDFVKSEFENQLRKRPDFVHESGTQLEIKQSRKPGAMRMRAESPTTMSFIFTFPARLTSKASEIEFKLLRSSQTMPDIGVVEVSSVTLDSGDFEITVRFPMSESFESVEKFKALMTNVVDELL